MIRYGLMAYLIVINLYTFVLYGCDKRKAQRGEWRIPERILIGTAFAGGSLGAWLGMQVFHHKTRHRKFRILIPTAVLFWCFLILIIFLKTT